MKKRYDESAKGMWGRATPIADGSHPNLFYNRDEIIELREMVLVRHTPQKLYDLYHSEIKGSMAEPAPDGAPETGKGHNIHFINCSAALSYMFEPNEKKAAAILAALRSFLRAFPDGLFHLGNRKNPEWNARACIAEEDKIVDWYHSFEAFNGMSLAWIFDLIQGLHPEMIVPEERIQIKEWFRKSAQPLKYISEKRIGGPLQWSIDGDSGDPKITREGKTISGYANWWSRDLMPSLACAFVSGSQEEVDFWADSGWPHEMLTADGYTEDYPPLTCNYFDMVMYLLAVFPSGANYDTYTREGYNHEDGTWHTNAYTAEGGAYHWAQMIGVMLGAEMAYHNGMTGVFEITDAGEPAILRVCKRAIESRTERDLQPKNLSGHPRIGYDSSLMLGYRRYADPVLEDAISDVAPYAGFDVRDTVLEFMGYPRRIVWPNKNI